VVRQQLDQRLVGLPLSGWSTNRSHVFGIGNLFYILSFGLGFNGNPDFDRHIV